MTLLDFIRGELYLTGTKEGCREGDCGACTVLIGEYKGGKTTYSTQNSCLLPIGSVHGKHVVTIEGINQKALTPFQEALVSEGAIQCGFCTPGMVMSLTGFLLSGKFLSLENAVDFMAGNLCRCTGYQSIKRAVQYFLTDFEINPQPDNRRLEWLVERGYLPYYFIDIPDLLKDIPEPERMDTPGIYIAGGTDVMLQKRDIIPDISLKFQKESKEEEICLEDGFIILDAGVTISRIMDSEILKSYFPDISNYARLFGSQQIRNRATLGGNIVNASPAADMVNILLALDSTLAIQGSQLRETALKDFYLGYKNLEKEEDELIVKVKFPLPEKGSFFNYEKISRRTHLDIASVNSSFLMKAEDGFIKTIHISAGGVAPVPLYLKETVSFLTGREITFENVRNAALIAQNEISPISDIRGSKEYKSLLLRQIIFAHFLKFSHELVESPEMLFSE